MPIASSTALDSVASRAIRYAETKLAAAADSLDMSKGFPRHTVGRDGAWVQMPVTQWTSGFFPGALWYAYELSGDPAFRARAERWTAGVESAKTRTNTHDIGFLLFPSFGNGYRLTGNPHYRDVILEGTRNVTTRFNPTVGAIKSWDVDNPSDPRSAWPGRYPVIIDNLMNLEMLFWAGKQPGGDPRWADIATRHAETSMRAHVRDDASTAHVTLFDPRTGKFLGRVTWQGDADTSAWARGQAWAIYGFTASYRATRKPEFLATARRVADWYLARLPDDYVPYWDFRAPGLPNEERDASAAAVACSALFELADLAHEPRYRAAAEKTLGSLATRYLTAGTGNAAILAHSVGSKPGKSEVDVGMIYADYYFLEALVRYERSRTGGR
ncbi:glycosyl hydrolase family 88 [Gemmatirosa kalamazoonensis]|uniref:Glycosyl hydrolase family 88 n=1 Tax=Gemmatirosa kalamazoonensis TaxID=861299 RepID=W0RD84_9BACT|nr:glycoside hydrolase family 88 protein [Gemmatirosa kalamazoonensis]AHG88736.1 glycosyl hydrolase family 88 [Gemmatirosa kalamazoonensis]